MMRNTRKTKTISAPCRELMANKAMGITRTPMVNSMMATE